jgi:hypothetical protein
MVRKRAFVKSLKMRKGKAFDKRFNDFGGGFIPVILCDVCNREIRRAGNIIFGKVTHKGRTMLFKRLTFTHKECYGEHVGPKEPASSETLLVEVDLDHFLESLRHNFSRPERNHR